MKTKTLMTITAVILVVVIAFCTYIFMAQHPFKRQYDRVAQLATEHYNIKQVDQFYWFTEDVTVFTVLGTTNTGERRYISVREDNGTVTQFNADELLNEQQAISLVMSLKQPTKILNVRFGQTSDGQPVWEVAYLDQGRQLGYYTLHAETGELVKDIGNI